MNLSVPLMRHDATLGSGFRLDFQAPWAKIPRPKRLKLCPGEAQGQEDAAEELEHAGVVRRIPRLM